MLCMFNDISLRARTCLLIGVLDSLIVFEILALSKIDWYKDSEVQRGLILPLQYSPVFYFKLIPFFISVTQLNTYRIVDYFQKVKFLKTSQ